MPFKNLVALLAIAIPSVFSSAAIAQTYINPEQFELIDFESIPDAFDYSITSHSGDSFNRSRLYSPVQTMFGMPYFLDNAIARDAEDAHKLYRELYYLQTMSGPVIRTVDIANPFNTSLRLNPSFAGPQAPVRGSEFLFEVAPPR
ncbi:hypothetical protein [Oscillatoria sp. FACHB-1406]|uniref:hypothetical protein n=1 Tax=Oscillatoria sp. FACHB-1406 TaxID=2692846 RepID=UPI001683C8B1|nr:hypothetical protein [Oscillatoria sp. FACHB-1406]MBD2576951.1 hypothetical protein [Oscillatoria sp. FACHB-1406]